MLEIEDYRSADFSQRTKQKYYAINYYKDISGDNSKEEYKEDKEDK